MTYGVGVRSLLQVREQLNSEASKLRILGRNNLLANRVDDHLAARWVRYQEVASLAFIVSHNFVKVAFKHYSEL